MTISLLKNVSAVKTSTFLRNSTIALLTLSSVFTITAHGSDNEINVYSARKEALILPLLEKFTKQTGIEVNLVTGKADALLQRLRAEGKRSPADVFITVDAGRLYRAKAAGVLQPISDSSLDTKVPAHLKDKDDYWYALSQRARVIFYALDRVKPAELSSYEDLTAAKWKNRICIRSSNNIYNQSLVASMIEVNGVEKTQDWLNNLINSFARPPVGGDRDQLKAAAAGQCDLAIANTYYFGHMINSNKTDEREAAAKLGLFWPNQGDGARGAHVNVSGIGVTKSSSNKEAAIQLIHFLLSDESQTWYAEVNNEYPVVEGIAFPKALKKYGTFKADSLNLTVLGENNRQAVEMMDKAGWK
ncbi:Fe(3+) ABC transporter substrate-binding protein [Marinomonas agarivorans]|nr:Fe(3+) ABC transporter substrate-binding protein [Marinomonas agarivorans]